MESQFPFDQNNELIYRVLATQNIWAVRENSTIQRDYVVPPASPVDFDIHNLDEKIAFSNMIDDESQKKINNHKENEKHIQNFEYKENIEYKQNFEYTENFEYKENKENIGNKSDRRRSNKGIECGFCKNYSDSIPMNNMHRLRDENGRVSCPRLRRYVCPNCGCTGDKAHTIKYCPSTQICVPELWR